MVRFAVAWRRRERPGECPVDWRVLYRIGASALHTPSALHRPGCGGPFSHLRCLRRPYWVCPAVGRRRQRVLGILSMRVFRQAGRTGSRARADRASGRARRDPVERGELALRALHAGCTAGTRSPRCHVRRLRGAPAARKRAGRPARASRTAARPARAAILSLRPPRNLKRKIYHDQDFPIRRPSGDRSYSLRALSGCGRPR